MSNTKTHDQDIVFLDCTLRDGGYYNRWDFTVDMINAYLEAMKASKVDVVEIGFRFLSNNGFKGPCAYSTDNFIRGLTIPDGITMGVMVNGADLLTNLGLLTTLEHLFPNKAENSPVDLVRIACHAHELDEVFPAVDWLAGRGYRVGLNLMQITARTHQEIVNFARAAQKHPVEVLYFADSLGNMTADDAARITEWFREGWDKSLGIHTHDNMGLALSNTLRAHAHGVTWLDSTVTGMGRGPGNARTEELMIELAEIRGQKTHMKPMMKLIREFFGPLKKTHDWGTNPYYFLSGKYSIHPTYVQKMLSDPRYTDDDIIAVLEHLRTLGGQKFSDAVLEEARAFYTSEARGAWDPKGDLAGQEVLILATGPGAARHRDALESYIRKSRPVVIAMNTQTSIAPELIDFRVACHPIRLLADSDHHRSLPQPLITPASMLPLPIREAFFGKELLDFGMVVEPETFFFGERHCVTPSSLVLAYTLAIAASGQAARILFAGFDGYPAGDARNDETEEILVTFAAHSDQQLLAVTPTRHRLPSASIYAL